jgi:hypothetical protein
MALDPGAIGRAFSQHRFDEALPYLANDVRWTVVGYMVHANVTRPARIERF